MNLSISLRAMGSIAEPNTTSEAIEFQSVASEPRRWLFSPRADVWLACGGASVALLAAVLVIPWHGDRKLDGLDFVLSEFHLGATYGVIMRRRLWRQRQIDVLTLPLVICARTYALALSGATMLLTSAAMYAVVWHRGRQSFGVARFYQRGMGGSVSRVHDCLFRGAIYSPMAAATLAYTYLAPTQYKGEAYFALALGKEITSIVALAAASWVCAYLAWVLWQNRREQANSASDDLCLPVHPGEWWIVLAHAVAFGSGYMLGASECVVSVGPRGVS